MSMPQHAPDGSLDGNPNTLWAEWFVEELVRSGLRAVCIAPGSRSTPLALACQRHPDLRLYIHLDERSAAFFALGMALESGKPVALVCTSGTAAAEFFPAVVEANQAEVPLLLLTADRPPELRHSGANQTVDQVKLYGDQVRWAIDMAVPDLSAPDVALRNVRRLANRAYATAAGVRPGPVQVNFPFRKPLESPPALMEKRAASAPAATFWRGDLVISDAHIAKLVTQIDASARGWIVCGPNCPRDFAPVVIELARRAGLPLLADPLSNVRFEEYADDEDERIVVGGYDSFLAQPPAWEPPDFVLRFGAVPTSKVLNDYLARLHEPPTVVHVRASGTWADDSQRVTHFIQADERLLCQKLTGALDARPLSAWARGVLASDAVIIGRLPDVLKITFFDGAAVVMAIEHALSQAEGVLNLVVGNSLPIRHVDQFLPALPPSVKRRSGQSLRLFANRGASGIDGVTSTALGVAASSGAPMLLITGDVSFYHDLNGLLALTRFNLTNVRILLLNNNGGSIFRRLPIARYGDAFEPLFLTPHNLDFAHVARFFDLQYEYADSAATFEQVLRSTFNLTQFSLIEVKTNGTRDQSNRQAAMKMFAQHQ